MRVLVKLGHVIAHTTGPVPDIDNDDGKTMCDGGTKLYKTGEHYVPLKAE